MPDGTRDTDGSPDVTRVRAAAVQMTSTDDVERNLEIARRLVGRAAGAGAGLVGLPENFASRGGGGDGDPRAALAEPPPPPGAAGPPGPILTAMSELARATNTYLL